MPDRVTRPPPSRTTRWLVFITRAVWCMGMVTGSDPQLKWMTPPRATARTTAREVQLPGVPCPTTRSARAVTARPAFGTKTCLTPGDAVSALVSTPALATRSAPGPAYADVPATSGPARAIETKASRGRDVTGGRRTRTRYG